MLATRVNDQTPTYPLIDEHGSILADATEAGTAINQLDYDPFGVQLTGPAAPVPTDPAAGLSDQSFDYLGAYGRAGVYGSDQIHMGARVYDPSTGRFICRDPLPGVKTAPQSQNPYAYGLNSPGRYWDLDGRNAVLVRGIGWLGGAIGTTGAAVWCMTNQEQCAVYNEEAWDTVDRAIAQVRAQAEADAIQKGPNCGGGNEKGTSGTSDAKAKQIGGNELKRKGENLLGRGHSDAAKERWKEWYEGLSKQQQREYRRARGPRPRSRN